MQHTHTDEGGPLLAGTQELVGPIHDPVKHAAVDVRCQRITGVGSLRGTSGVRNENRSCANPHARSRGSARKTASQRARLAPEAAPDLCGQWNRRRSASCGNRNAVGLCVKRSGRTGRHGDGAPVASQTLSSWRRAAWTSERAGAWRQLSATWHWQGQATMTRRQGTGDQQRQQRRQRASHGERLGRRRRASVPQRTLTLPRCRIAASVRHVPCISACVKPRACGGTRDQAPAGSAPPRRRSGRNSSSHAGL